jgi:hypothetical protein
MRRPIVVLAVVTLATVVACGGDTAPAVSVGGQANTGAASFVPDPNASPSPSPEPTVDPEGELCLIVAETGRRLALLRAIELRLPNRVALEIELDRLMAAFGEIENADLGSREDELERSLTRLGYRLRELELAVEDFHTNPRPLKAVPHVEDRTQKVADELSAFTILSRC